MVLENWIDDLQLSRPLLRKNGTWTKSNANICQHCKMDFSDAIKLKNHYRFTGHHFHIEFYKQSLHRKGSSKKRPEGLLASMYTKKRASHEMLNQTVTETPAPHLPEILQKEPSVPDSKNYKVSFVNRKYPANVSTAEDYVQCKEYSENVRDRDIEVDRTLKKLALGGQIQIKVISKSANNKNKNRLKFENDTTKNVRKEVDRTLEKLALGGQVQIKFISKSVNN